MITNERQYRITRSEAERFEQALAQAEEQGGELDPRLRWAMREALESQLEELREELAEYDALRSGQVSVMEFDSLMELPEALIRARIAASLTQKELAARLRLKEQQIQRYEATRYSGVDLKRIHAVAEALGVKIHERITLPTVAGGGSGEGGLEGRLDGEGTPSHAYGLAGTLRRLGLTLHDLAARLRVPNGFALKLQRGRVATETLPARFLSMLSEILGLEPAEARVLVAPVARRPGHVYLRAQGQLGSPPEPEVQSFREALESCPDLTPEQRREWLG